MLVPRSSFLSSDVSDVFSTSPSESSPITLSEHSSRSPRSSNAGTTHPSRTHEMRNLILHGTSRMSNDHDSGVNGAVPHPPSFLPLENEKEPSTSGGSEKNGEEGLNVTPRTNYFVHPPTSNTVSGAKTVIDILLKEEAQESRSDTFQVKENMGDREGKEEFVVEDTERKKPKKSISLNISGKSSQAAPPLSTTTSVSITITSPTDASSAVTSPTLHSFFSVASLSAPDGKSDSTTFPISTASPRFLRSPNHKDLHRTAEKEVDSESEAKQKKVGDVASVKASTVSPSEAANDSSAEQRSAAVPSALSSSLSEVLTTSSKKVDLLESESSSSQRGRHLHDANSSGTTTTLISVSSHYPSLGSLQNSDVRSSPSTHVVPSEISHLNDHLHRSSTPHSDLLQPVDGLPPPPPAVSVTAVDSTPPLSFPPFQSHRRSREEKKIVEGELLHVDYSGGEDTDTVYHRPPPPSTSSPAPPHSTPSSFLLSCPEEEDTVPSFTHENKEPPPQRLSQENEGNLLLDSRPMTIPSAFDVPSSFDLRSRQEHMTVGSIGTERKRIAGSGGGGGEVITLNADGKESEGFYPSDGTGGEKNQELRVVVEGRGQENDEMAQKKRKGSLSLPDAREEHSEKKNIEEICHSAIQYDDPPHHLSTPSSTILSSRVGNSESNSTDKKSEHTNGSQHSSDRLHESSDSRRSSGRMNGETFLTATSVTTTEMHILGNADMHHRRLHDARDDPVLTPKTLDEEKVRKTSNALLEARQEEKGIHSGGGRSSSRRNKSAKKKHKEEDDCHQKGGNSSTNKKLSSENRVVKNSDQREIKKGSRHSLSLVSSKPSSHSFSRMKKKDTPKTVATTDEESHFSTVTENPPSSRSSSKKHDASGRTENQHARKNSGVTSSSSSFSFTSSLSSWKSGSLDIPTGTRSSTDSRTISSAEKRSSHSRWKNTDAQSQKNPKAQRRLSSLLLSSPSQEKNEHSASRTRVRQQSFTPFGKAVLVTHSPTTSPLPLEAAGDIVSVPQAPQRGEQKAAKHLAQNVRTQKNDAPEDTCGVITARHSSPFPFSDMAAPRHNTLLFFPHPPLKAPLPAVSRGNVKYSRQLLALREKNMALDMRVAMLQKKAALPDAARGDPEREREKIEKREKRQRIKLAQLRGYHGKCERKPSLPDVSRGDPEREREKIEKREEMERIKLAQLRGYHGKCERKPSLPDVSRGDPEREREKIEKREEMERIKLAQLRGYHGKCERKPSLPDASRGDPEKERKRVAAEEKKDHLHLHLSSAPLPSAARGAPTSYSMYSPSPPPDWDPGDPRYAYFWRDSVMRSQLPNWVNFSVGEQLHEERVLHYGGKYGDSLWDPRPWDPQRRAMYATNDVPPVRYSKSVSARLAQELKRLEAAEVAEAERKDLLELQAQWKIRCGPFHHRSLTGSSFSTTSSQMAGSTPTTKRTTTHHPQSRSYSGGSPTIGSVVASRGDGDRRHAKRRHLESKKDDEKGRKRDRRRTKSCPIPTPAKKLHPTDTKALTTIHGVVQRERASSAPPPPTGTIFTACTQDETPEGGTWNLREKDEAYPFQKNPYITPALNAYRKAELKSIFQQYQMVAGKTGKRGEEGNLLLLDDAVQEPVSPYRRGVTYWEKRKNTSAAGSHHPHRVSRMSSSHRRKSNRRHRSAVHSKHKNATAAPYATSTDGVVGGIGGGFSGLGAHTVSPYLDGDRRGYLTFLHPYSPESDSRTPIAERRKAGKENGDEGNPLGRQPSRKRSREGHPQLHLSLKNFSAYIPRQRDWNTRSDNLMEDRLHDPSGSVYSWWAGHTYLTPWEEKGEPPPPPRNPVTSPLPTILETFQASRGGGGGQPRTARHFSKSIRNRSKRAKESKKKNRDSEKKRRKRTKKARLEEATRNHTSKRQKRNSEAKKKEQRNARGKSSAADFVEADDTQEDKAVRRAERSDPRGEGYKMAAKKRKEQLHNPVFYDLYGNRRILTTVQTAANVARLKKKCLRQDRLGYYEEDRSQVHLSMLKTPRPLSLLPSTGVPDPSDVPSMFDTHTLHHVWHHPQLKNISVHKSGVPLDSSYDYLLSRHGFWGQTAEAVVS